MHKLHYQNIGTTHKEKFRSVDFGLQKEPGIVIIVLSALLGTLSNRRRRPDDGNRKRDISFETSLRMYNTL